MPMFRPARATTVISGLLVLLALPALAGCGSDAASSGSSSNGSGDKIAIEATDSACTVARTTLDPGSTTFAVTNKGTKITEVYVYGEQGGAFNKIVGEVENVGPGTSRDLVVKLGGGRYQVACKPGQTGDGIRTRITVSGATSGSGASSAASDAPSTDGASTSYDREIEMEIEGTTLTGGDGLTGRVDEKVEFKLTNRADGVRELEVLDPTGKIVHALDVAKGAAGEFVVALNRAGSWTIKIEDGPSVIERKLTVS